MLVDETPDGGFSNLDGIGVGRGPSQEMLDGAAVGMNCSRAITAAFQGRRVQVNHAGDLHQRRTGATTCSRHVLSFGTGSPLKNMVGLCAVRVELVNANLKSGKPQDAANIRGLHIIVAHA